jgi:hypothetical protein
VLPKHPGFIDLYGTLEELVVERSNLGYVLVDHGLGIAQLWIVFRRPWSMKTVTACLCTDISKILHCFDLIPVTEAVSNTADNQVKDGLVKRANFCGVLGICVFTRSENPKHRDGPYRVRTMSAGTKKTSITTSAKSTGGPEAVMYSAGEPLEPISKLINVLYIHGLLIKMLNF